MAGCSKEGCKGETSFYQLQPIVGGFCKTELLLHQPLNQIAVCAWLTIMAGQDRGGKVQIITHQLAFRSCAHESLRQLNEIEPVLSDATAAKHYNLVRAGPA